MGDERIDFEAEGLLEGLDSEEERGARRDLLQELHEAGVSVEELKRAVAEERLVLLPIELFMRRDCRYTLAEAARHADVSEEFALADWLALGLPRPAPDEPVGGEQEVAAYRMLKQVMDAGFPEERVLNLARVFGRAAAQVTDSLVEEVALAFLQADETERDLGLRFADLATNLLPLYGPLVETALRLHLRESIANAMLDRAARVTGRLPGATFVSICFADMVGFTVLSEAAPSESVGDLARRFGDLAGEVAEPPVRLVKLIGDGAMLVSGRNEALVRAARALLEGCREASLPALRIGIARGEALNRGGDWYGRTVNLASRISDVAPPGEVVGTSEVADSTRDGYSWEELDAVSLRGIAEPVRLYRLLGAGPGRAAGWSMSA